MDRRCVEMVEAGLIDEVRRLREAGYDSVLAPMRSIGYREVASYLDGVCTLDQAVHDMARATRRLAKPQLTWFRGIAGLRWFDATSVQAQELAESFW